mmetsp:Transcript_26741/g.57972  ORF Transcript_26741/g.57972 Transcript_26741/m.57972 type:complete len:244 (+) Transcript_26741:137-868(+)
MGVDDARSTRLDGVANGGLKFFGSRGGETESAERLCDLFVLCGWRERGGRDVGRVKLLHAAVDAIVVDDHDDDWQVKPTEGLELESGEAKRAVAFDRDHRLVRMNDLGGHGKSHAHAHCAVGAGVNAVSGEAIGEHSATDIHGVAAFRHNHCVVWYGVADGPQGGVVVHGDDPVGFEVLGSLVVGGNLGIEDLTPLAQVTHTASRPQRSIQLCDDGLRIADEGGVGRTIGVHLLGRHVDLDDL